MVKLEFFFFENRGGEIGIFFLTCQMDLGIFESVGEILEFWGHACDHVRLKRASKIGLP